MSIAWEKTTKNKFDQMIDKIPFALREIARDKVFRSAEQFAQNNNHTEIIEKDMVDAFFKETPGGFHGPLTLDMEELGIDYKQYGYP